MDASKLDFGYFLASCLVTGCTMLVNRPLLSLLQEDCNLEQIIMHDWWASLVASAFGKVIYIDRATISYRQHGDNSVGAVKFSIGAALKTLKKRALVEDAAINQVQELLRVYGARLPLEHKKQAESITKLRGRGLLGKFILLSKANAWRKGIMRNFATLLSFLLIPGPKSD